MTKACLGFACFSAIIESHREWLEATEVITNRLTSENMKPWLRDGILNVEADSSCIVVG
jgi:hypothetical protein